MRSVPVPKKAIIAPVIALCLDIQLVIRPKRVSGTTAGGGGFGFTDCGSHDADDSAPLKPPARFSKCLSVKSKISAVNFRTSLEMLAS